jgi:CubicO group peptidase (beta-lactamase class C family)
VTSEDLAARVAKLLGSRHPVFAAATVDGAGITLAVRGAEIDADFEIGSISKAFTGLLYAEAVARGEIAPTTTLGDLLPLGDAPAARITLRSLSIHRSGLSRAPRGVSVPLRRTWEYLRRGANPFGDSLAELIEQARCERVGPPRPQYSNFGFELLGHALGAAAGTTYAGLLASRVAEPLGLMGIYVPMSDAELRPSAVPGRSRGGRPRPAGTGAALGPAGGIRANIGDMGRLAAALLDGTAPGAAALDPVEKLTGKMRIGAAWVTMTARGREITWHNGGTGGFRSWLGLDRAAGTGAAILSATASSVDDAGFKLVTAGAVRRPVG